MYIYLLTPYKYIHTEKFERLLHVGSRLIFEVSYGAQLDQIEKA